MREEILKAEQHLLRILNYDLTNPYVEEDKLLLNYLKFINGEPSHLPSIKLILME